jgi:xylulokinase
VSQPQRREESGQSLRAHRAFAVQIKDEWTLYMIKTWVAFDVGTTGTKAALIDARGNVLRSATREYPTHSADGGIVEQEAGDWWRAACDAAREIDASNADAIAITGQMQNAILIDRDGESVRPVILYSDSRARAEADEVSAILGAQRLTHLTGNEQGAGGLLAKLRWLAAHERANLLRAHHLLLGAADVIAYRLTGNAASDTTTASTTGLMELASCGWLILQRGIKISDNLAAATGVNLAPILPRLVAGGAQVGEVGQSASEALGVRAGIPVHLGPGDAGAATLGAGSGVVGKPYAYVGTSGWVAYTSAERGDPATGVFTLAHPQREHYICVAPLLTAAGNFEWLKGIIGAESYAGMIDAAVTAPMTKLLYLPYLNGERSPFSDPLARGAFIGLSSGHTAVDMTRAVLEGVAFAYRHALDALIAAPVSRLLLTGGGAQSPGWNQMLADVTGVEVAVARDAANVGVRGAVLAAQVARGERADYALPEFAISASYEPDDGRADAYGEKYAWFRAAYRALKGLFGQMG